MNVPDPYKTLQVDPEAEEEVIEAAYRRLARKYHPDVSPGAESEARMVRINQAWELLRDPVSRAAVDRARARGRGSSDRPRAGAGVAENPGRPRTQHVSRDWTSGRSAEGAGYDPTTMGRAQGTGAAGPPPGNPSGSTLGFGRYAGWSLGEIARVDLEYLEWLDRMPIGRAYHDEIDGLLRRAGRRRSVPPGSESRRGLFRRR